MTDPRVRRAAGLGGVLATIGVVVGLKAAAAPGPVRVHVTPTPAAAPPRSTPPISSASPATPATPASPATSPAAGSAGPPTTVGVRQVTGDAVDNPYGTVQVRVTLRGSRITDVTTVQVPGDRGRSVEIARQAVPLLRLEVLKAQSAQIDAVSGASYDSQGYAQSLQSALDRARQ